MKHFTGQKKRIAESAAIEEMRASSEERALGLVVWKPTLIGQVVGVGRSVESTLMVSHPRNRTRIDLCRTTAVQAMAK